MEQSQPMTQTCQTQIRGEKQMMKGKTQNPETKRAHQINHLMVASSRHKYAKKCLQGFLKTLNLEKFVPHQQSWVIS